MIGGSGKWIRLVHSIKNKKNVLIHTQKQKYVKNFLYFLKKGILTHISIFLCFLKNRNSFIYLSEKVLPYGSQPKNINQSLYLITFITVLRQPFVLSSWRFYIVIFSDFCFCFFRKVLFGTIWLIKLYCINNNNFYCSLHDSKH